MMNDTERKLISFMSRCRDRSGLAIQHSVAPSSVSKFVIESYIGNSLCTCKIFLYSSERASNNKPYVFERQITIETAQMVSEMFQNHRNVVDEDIFNEDEDIPLLVPLKPKEGF